VVSRKAHAHLATPVFFGLYGGYLPLLSNLQGQTCVSNRGSTWDWTIPVAQTVYLNGSSGIVARAVNLPYYDVEGFATNLNIPGSVDVFPSDGWELLYRSFGNPSCGVNVPYFILYNRFNGLLRLFFYNHITDQTFSSGEITLAETSGSLTPLSATPLLSFDGGDPTHPLMTVDSVGPDAWSYADFSVTFFDPSPVRDATLEFKIDGVTSTNLHIDGNLTLDQVLSNAHVSGTVDLTGAVKAADSNYRTFTAAQTDLNKAANSSANRGQWWVPVVSTLAKGANLASTVSAVAGFIESFIGGGKTQAPPMHFQGQIQATGTLTTVVNLTQLIMRVPGAPHSNLNDDALPFNDLPLGVFQANIPVVDGHFESGGCIQITCITGKGMILQSETPLVIHFNPNSTSGASVHVTWGWTFAGQSPSSGPETLVTGNSVSLNLGGRFTVAPIGIFIKLRIIPASAPLGQDPIVVLKTFPVFINNLGIQ
jgi:hypothetical protein